MNEENQKTLNANAFGLDEKAAESIRTDILPAVPLGDVPVGDSIRVKIISEEPELITHKQKNNTGEEVEVQTPVLKVNNVQSGMGETLWLSSSSLKRELFKVAKQVGNLSGVELIIKVEEYKHETYGKCRGYRAQVVKSEETKAGE